MGECGFGIAAPVAGRVVPLDTVNDQVFSSGMLGKGCGIVPAPGCEALVVPTAGVVSVTMESSRHALCLTTDDGVELLLHVGIDTVGMRGVGFAYHVARGDRVAVGQPLMSFSQEAIVAAGLDSTVLMVVSNTDDFSRVEVATSGDVVAGDKLLVITR
ncbi:glucose PTS transporter subunit IIA [uncultured Parolsenella sp.]|uniref:PTS sugar transporter subunit IIA n=1 Tax=uncultured Parolsenella sp. TaxID=2083008 RepID=UPI0025D542EF|nr:glucose PTS transporter subunit IIA [uncultured Parolsenella sp.]